MLAQVNYWINVMPAQQATETLMSTAGGLQVGSWAINCDSDKVRDILLALKGTYVDPLVRLAKQNEITAIQTMKLDALRQFKWVVDLIPKKTLGHGIAFQVLEPTESQFMTIVHNVRVEYPEQ